MAHQSSIGVAGHNIANVDTPGYSRQVLNLTTTPASPEGAGFFGNGVRADTVSRQYDQFMVKRLADQNTSIKNMQMEQQTMRVVETIFNEAPGLAVNDLMSQFWEATQVLANNPELSASRQAMVQQAELLNDQLHTMSTEIVNSRNDISVSIKTTVDKLNVLAKELADLNGQITSSETPRQKQNDLRDTRDNLLNEMSGIVGVNFFETSTGAYTVLLDDGHTVVEDNDSWSFEWSDEKLYWNRTNSNNVTTKSELNDATALGGSLGGLIDVNSQLVEGNPDNYLGRLNSLANSLIREVNQVHSQGAGLVKFSQPLTSAEVAKDTTLLHTTLDNQVAAVTIPAGTFKINGLEIGKIDGAAAIYGRAMGKAYNAVQAINSAAASVEASLTTQVAGDAVTGGTNGGLDNGETVTFSINSVQVSYTATSNETAAQTAVNVADSINTALTTYNAVTSNIPKVTIRADVGNGLNGGAVDSIILKNTNEGDSSQIIIAGVDSTDPAEAKLGLSDGTYQADARHNTGTLSVFAMDAPIVIDGGSDDTMLSQLGWASSIQYSDKVVTPPTANQALNFTVNGVPVSATALAGDLLGTQTNIINAVNNVEGTTGVHAKIGDGTNGGVINSILFQSDTANIDIKGVDSSGPSPNEADIMGFSDTLVRSVAGADQSAGDGKLSYEFVDNGVLSSIHGYAYSQDLQTDGGSFKIWLYNSNGSNALPQPVSIPLDRVYTLQDVADNFNSAMANAKAVDSSGEPWVKATVFNNKLTFTPNGGHQFAFGGDDSNFLATAGINTFFTGSSADSIGVNSVVTDDLNFVAAAQVNKFGEMFRGDNSNILAITDIQRKENISFTGGSTDTLDGHYNSLVAEIGLKSKSVSSDLEFNIQVNDQLNIIRDTASGVSLDEEMANLIKFQHAYSAAAKLITSSDEMLKTLLNAI